MTSETQAKVKSTSKWSIRRVLPTSFTSLFRWILSFFFFITAYYINILASVVSGWRTPHLEPLPDIGHDLLRPYFEGLEELYGPAVVRHLPDTFVLILAALVALLLILGSTERRMVISRRLFVVVGMILLFRAYCVTVTSLPDMSPHCRLQFEKSYWLGRAHETGRYKALPVFPAAIWRANKVFKNPFADTCGDLMFSGHTVALWVCALVYYEYCTSRTMVLMTFVMACTGTVVIVGTMFHYTLDVSVAIFVTYTCWTFLHRYAKNHILQLHAGTFGKLMYWMEETEEISESKVYY